jgi:hypothetical protein
MSTHIPGSMQRAPPAPLTQGTTFAIAAAAVLP